MNSPFSEGRFEYDAQHCFYLPKESFTELEQHKPAYLIGSRGSGKTTLLMSLNWKERLRNRTLLRQLSNDAFRGLYIGTYVKLPRIQLSSFEKWLEASEQDIHGMILGLYLDFIFAEKMSRAVAEMLADGALKISPKIETDCVRSWNTDLGVMTGAKSSKPFTSVASFNQGICDARRRLEHLARTRASVEDSLKEFPVEQIGSFGTTAANQLAELCNRDTLGKDGKWHFKVCMDEGECLTDFQQVVVNTIVRLSEWPLFPIVSYVSRPADISTTLVPHLTHQKADRKLIVLDTMKQSDFIELAEGVASVRCQEFLGNPNEVFRSKTSLGSLNMNRLIQRVVERSESQLAKALKDNAHDFNTPGERDTDATLPFYQAYLAHKLGLEMQQNASKKQKRNLDSQQFRKKMVAAYLSICRDLKLRTVPYAYAEMVIGISDNCVRDFLSQLDHIFRESKLSLEEFLRTEVDLDCQAKAIRNASIEKRDSLPESGVLWPVETGRIAKGLAMITAMVQSTSDDGSHLRSTERGLFRLMRNGNDLNELAQALELVRDASDAGFLRMFEKENSAPLFRVHASLAPAYGFSYRDAYYPIPLSLEDFNRLKSASTDNELSKTAKMIVKSIPKDFGDLPLFTNAEDTEP